MTLKGLKDFVNSKTSCIIINSGVTVLDSYFEVWFCSLTSRFGLFGF